MVLPKETIIRGATDTCPDCNIKLVCQILHSATGYYIGTQCNCGPYSRESGYFKSYTKAKLALDEDFFERL